MGAHFAHIAVIGEAYWPAKPRVRNVRPIKVLVTTFYVSPKVIGVRCLWIV